MTAATHPDLSDAARRVLATLAAEPDRPHKLAELGVNRSGMLSIAATLERRGYVRWQRTPLIGRGVATLALTVAGMQEARRAAEH